MPIVASKTFANIKGEFYSTIIKFQYLELAAHFGAKETERLNGAHDLGQSSH